MKNTLLFITLILLGSCTIQKRIHTGGYHVEWKKRYQQKTPVSNEKDAVENESTEVYLADREQLNLSDSLDVTLLNDTVVESQFQMESPKNKNPKKSNLIHTISKKALLNKKINIIKVSEKAEVKEGYDDESKMISNSYLTSVLSGVVMVGSILIAASINLELGLACFGIAYLLCLIFSIRTIVLSIRYKKDYYMIFFAALNIIVLLLIAAALISLLFFY